jgi:hypothetical protein
MTETVVVRPAAGRRVRHPETQQPMGQDWVELPRDGWLIRRLADGDLEEQPAPPAEPTGADEKPARTTREGAKR